MSTTEQYDYEGLYEMVTKLSRVAIESSISDSGIRPLLNVLEEKRMREACTCLREFEKKGKPDDFTTGFALEPHVGIDGSVEVVDDVLNLHEGSDPIVLCAVLLGNRGECLAFDDIDTALSETKNGGIVLRSGTQLLPLLKLPAHEKGKVEQIAALRRKIESTLSGSFGTPAHETNFPGWKVPPPLPSHSSDYSSITKGVAASRRTTGNCLDRVQIWDVMCDRRDVRCANHFGNRRFAIIVCMHMAKNQDLLNVDVRVRVARSIIHTIRNGRPGGRFLAKTKRNTWKDIGDNLALRWVSLILKTAAINAIEAKKRKEDNLELNRITNGVSDVELK